MRIAPTSLAAALLLGAAALRPAAALPFDATTAGATTAVHRDAVADAVVRPLIHVRLTPQPGVRVPAHVAVADSAGRLVASFRLRGEGIVRPMMVTVEGDDIVLKADTPEGQLAIRLNRLNDPSARGRLSGEWMLGSRSGMLTGHARR